MEFFAKCIVSLCGVGYIRPASATWGSIVSGVALFFVFPHMAVASKCLATIIIFGIGVFLADYLEKKTGHHDPHYVVIDEAVGMMIVCFFLPAVWWQFLCATVLFRIFDIAKVWPASYFDKRPGGFASMIDDVIMAVPALVALHLILILF